MTRTLQATAAALAVAVAIGAIVLGSQRVRIVDRTRQVDVEASRSAVPAALPTMRHAGEPVHAAPPPVTPIDKPTAAPDGKPPLDRIEPRAPLSAIGQALPPPPVAPEDWKPTTLFQPVATAAGVIEAKGYSIAIAGVEPVQADETCTAGGASWPCGARARAAFRAFLRGRAVSCVVPPQPERGTLSVDCSIGKTDVAAWLVGNGWARAAAGSPLADAAQAAQTAGKGIYGAAPDLNAPAETTTTSAIAAPPGGSDAILAPSSAEPLQGATPTTGFDGAFPSAPPAPGAATPPAAPPAPRQ